MTGRTYHALHFGAVYVTSGRQTCLLAPHFDVRRHSDTGYSWGRPTPGAQQLAIAILIDHFGATNEAVSKALDLYLQFVTDVIAKQDRHGPFELSTEQIDRWVKSIEMENA